MVTAINRHPTTFKKFFMSEPPLALGYTLKGRLSKNVVPGDDSPGNDFCAISLINKLMIRNLHGTC
jgi:hypothetical protein